MNEPVLSVIMPAFNGEKYISYAIESVLNQSFENFEFLLINDGSIDRTLHIMSSYDDERIRIINLKENKGIATCRNIGLREANGEFLAWTDCDDLNELNRFEEQVAFLKENPDYGGCGTWLSRFNGEITHYISKAEENPKKIKASLLFKPASIPNATVMLRLSEIRKKDLWYNEKFKIAEDYDFINRCSQLLKFTNIQKVLYKYRESETSIVKQFDSKEQENYEFLKEVYSDALRFIGISASEKQLQIHHNICSQKILFDFSEYENCAFWLKQIQDSNTKLKIHDPEILREVISDQFFFVSKKASVFGLKTLFFFINSSIKNEWRINPRNYMKLAARCALKYDKFEFKL